MPLCRIFNLCASEACRSRAWCRASSPLSFAIAIIGMHVDVTLHVLSLHALGFLSQLRYYATGWQPGHELFEHNREKFLLAFVRQHQSRGSPLMNKSPHEVIEMVTKQIGTIARPLFTLHRVQGEGDGGNDFVHVIQDMPSQECVHLPHTGGEWHLSIEHDMTATVTDGASIASVADQNQQQAAAVSAAAIPNCASSSASLVAGHGSQASPPQHQLY
jgi:hypothetical protein